MILRSRYRALYLAPFMPLRLRRIRGNKYTSLVANGGEIFPGIFLREMHLLTHSYFIGRVRLVLPLRVYPSVLTDIIRRSSMRGKWPEGERERRSQERFRRLRTHANDFRDTSYRHKLTAVGKDAERPFKYSVKTTSRRARRPSSFRNKGRIYRASLSRLIRYKRASKTR